LTAEDITVEFSSVETFEQNAIFVETNEKSFKGKNGDVNQNLPVSIIVQSL
jgi:hypothetical protein